MRLSQQIKQWVKWERTQAMQWVLASNAVNQTASEIGKNASAGGQSLLNQTGEVAKKIVGGAATVLGNISGEIKKGIGEK